MTSNSGQARPTGFLRDRALLIWLIVGLILGSYALIMNAGGLMLAPIALGAAVMVFSYFSFNLSTIFLIGCVRLMRSHEEGGWMALVSGALAIVAMFFYVFAADGWMEGTFVLAGITGVWLIVAIPLCLRYRRRVHGPASIPPVVPPVPKSPSDSRDTGR